MIVSIHQPNYLPWLGFFDKIARSDIFVIFDNVQFPRGKQHFGHRNLIKTDKDPKWLTVSLNGKSEFKNFNEIEVNYNVKWNVDHINLIKNFYRKSKYYNLYFSNIETILNNQYKTLSDLNVELIKYFLSVLNINTKILLSSELCPNEITGGERIMQILKKLNATKYISGTGPGSMRYINEQEFKDCNIELIWQEYKHPTYTQLHGEFKPYMCILDLLFNEGENSKGIILS
jgi:hypothetical protein